MPRCSCRLALTLLAAACMLGAEEKAPPPAEAGHKLPAEVLEVLEKADAIELFSLTPESKPAANETALFSWKVRGQRVVRDAGARKTLLDELKKGVAAYDNTDVFCFKPHHAIKAVAGEQSVTLVICFECKKIRIHRGGPHQFTDLGITGQPAQALLEALDVPDAPASAKP